VKEVAIDLHQLDVADQVLSERLAVERRNVAIITGQRG